MLPQDVVYCMLSHLMDDVGLPLKGDPLNDTVGKRVADSLIAVLVDHDFERVSGLILGGVDECVAWLVEVHKAKKGLPRGGNRKPLLENVDQHLTLVRDALTKTQACLSRYNLKCTRSPVGHEVKWRGRGGVERGAEKQKGGGDGRRSIDLDWRGSGRNA